MRRHAHRPYGLSSCGARRRRDPIDDRVRQEDGESIPAVQQFRAGRNWTAGHCCAWQTRRSQDREAPRPARRSPWNSGTSKTTPLHFSCTRPPLSDWAPSSAITASRSCRRGGTERREWSSASRAAPHQPPLASITADTIESFVGGSFWDDDLKSPKAEMGSISGLQRVIVWHMFSAPICNIGATLLESN